MKENKAKKSKMSYEPEADVLRIEASKKPIDHASEVGNLVIHFNSEGQAVYFEILEASKFLKQAESLLPSSLKREMAFSR